MTLYNEKGKLATDDEVFSENGRRRAARNKSRGPKPVFSDVEKAEIRRIVALPLDRGGMTQMQIAELKGVSYSLICKIVQGRK
jgi:hypothetical protein